MWIDNGHDKTDPGGFDIASFSEIAAEISSGFLSMTTDLGADASIKLPGPCKHQIAAADFIFA